MGSVSVFLLDSVILIDHLNGVQGARAFLTTESLHSAISFVTYSEVIAGSSPKELQRVIPWLDSFPFLGIDSATAKLAGLLRQEHRWKLPDAFQAALAMHHGLRLITRNTRDFPPAKYPFVQVPYGAP